MAHEVESMVYTNEVPWHGLGVHVEKAPDVDALITLAGLDWTVSKRQMVVLDPKGTLQVPGKYALVRDTDRTVLDVVGGIYTPTQNREAMELFREFVATSAATMETAGSLKGGRYVWALCSLNQQFKLSGNDMVKGYILLASPHQQGKSLVIRPTSVRVVCNNTLSWALAGKVANEFRHAHRANFDASTITDAKEALGIAREQFAAFEKQARALKNLKLVEDDVVRVLAEIFQPEANAKALINDFEEEASPRLKRVLDIHDHAPGADPGTGWGVLNAVTYYADHVASRNPDNRLTSAWMGNMARIKVQAQDLLLQKAA